MGHITDAIDVAETCLKYSITDFVETGTGDGSTAVYVASSYPGVFVHTIEMVPKIFHNTKEKYDRYKNISFYLGSSEEKIGQVIANLRGPTLFWLDAHFPGADYGLAGYADCKENNIRLPLARELDIIHSLRDISGDVFVMDDLRIYEDGPYTAGNWVERQTLGGNGCDFVYDILADTHSISKTYNYQGAITAVPK